MPAGSATARASTSRTDLWDESSLSEARQSAENRSRSNIDMLPFGNDFAKRPAVHNHYTLVGRIGEARSAVAGYALQAMVTTPRAASDYGLQAFSQNHFRRGACRCSI